MATSRIRLCPRQTAVVLSLWLAGLTTSCADGAPWNSAQIDSAVAEILWLPEVALVESDWAKPVMIQNGRSIYIDGSAAVVFSIDSDQDELSTLLTQHFATAGWQQRQTQYLNPQLVTSFATGWQTHGGGLLPGPFDSIETYQPYRRWHGEWTDDQGNIVEYHIGGQGRRLQGVGGYIPRQVVESTVQKKRRAIR